MICLDLIGTNASTSIVMSTGVLDFMSACHVYTNINSSQEQIMAGDASADGEFDAMQAVYKALEPLDEGARTRVLNYVIDRLGVTAKLQRGRAEEAGDAEDEALHEEEAEAPKYDSFAELHDAAHPQSQADKALVAGYWLQVCQGGDSFDGMSANKELKNLG